MEVATLKKGHIQATLKASTHLEAEESVQVFSRTSNHVKELLVEEGDGVKKGELLLVLENAEQENTLEKAKVQHEKALREFERQKSLYEQSLISEQAYSDAQFELKQRKLSLEEAQQQYDYTQIRAPIAGTITERVVNLGDYVKPNQHLFSLVDFNSLVAYVYLPEKNLPQLAVDQPCRLVNTALGSKPFKGRVKRISPVVDPQTGTFKVTISAPNQGYLRPGLFIETRIILETHEDALLIPKQALVYDEDQLYVYRLDPTHNPPTAHRVLVEPLLTDPVHVEPAHSFDSGDLVVIGGQTGLKEGAAVRIIRRLEEGKLAVPEEGKTTNRSEKSIPAS